ncbi:hypothetical protein tloyanaT_08150 [Thalassotalea loyana]|uniref:Sulfotransferase family protein n=1 Tax=Thalassotalea loyana TaxID=280483 RepID=A0ABQ6H8W8_9GAMM|nr:tetratricopeptide repeat-containing sulfotransferase family protein [Thalassotalea loyana]GLX84563.1 hypothetical protein tloyanaT_08150 [Thalassotalea loyana]
MTLPVHASIKEAKLLLQSSQFAKAELATSQILQQAAPTTEEKAELIYIQAVALRYQGKLIQAQEALKHFLSENSNYARGYQELGYCELAAEKTEKALVAFHKAVELNPALIASWQKIAELFKIKQHKDTEQVHLQLNVLKKLPPQVLGAMDLMYEGKLHKAEQVCRKFLLNNKHQVDAMCLLAEIGLKLKVFDDAEFLLESCVSLYPDNEQANALYINVLNRLGKFKKCAEHAKQFLTKSDIQEALKVTAQATLANCYINLGELSKGTTIYQQILARSPERSGIDVQLGHAYKTAGDYQKAIAAYQQAYAKQSNYGDAYWSLANTKTYQFNDKELSLMKAQLLEKHTSINDKVHICFSLGKAFEDRKSYKESFEYYSQGNVLKKQSIGYNAKKSTALIEQQITHCTKSLFERKAGQGNQSQDPIFILGLPRAGSTLLEQILASHSQVDGTMELHNIMGHALKLRGRIVSGDPLYPKNLWQLSKEQLNQLGDMYINDTKVYRKEAPYFIDKMPNNFIHIGLIKLILPNAKIIDARREPMACCFSGFKQLFGEGQDFSYDLSDIATYYRDYACLMAHWDEVLPGQILRVQHEALVNDVESEVKRILEYCNLPFEQSCIEFYKTKRNIHTPSAEQVRQPINRKGLSQWTNFSPYLIELESKLKKFNLL